MEKPIKTNKTKGFENYNPKALFSKTWLLTFGFLTTFTKQ
jgi:hypothetical protein